MFGGLILMALLAVAIIVPLAINLKSTSADTKSISTASTRKN
jgi:hypothetical protein